MGITTPLQAQSDPSASQEILHDQEFYEKEIIAAALAAKGLTRDPAPQGKKIQNVEIITHDILLPRDPYPLWLNKIHTTTQDWIIERELLFRPGDSWNDDYAYETERIIRKWLPLAWVRIIPARSVKDSNQLQILVLTQDLWSLRTNFNVSFVGSKLELFELQVVESNLLGQAIRVGPTFSLDLATVAYGGTFFNYRIGKSDIQVKADADMVWNRDSGVREGHHIITSISRPLYRLDDRWGGELSLDLTSDFFRLFSAGSLSQVSIAETGQSVPFQYRRETMNLSARATHSLGRLWKRQWSMGYGFFSKQYPLTATGLSIQTVSLFSERFLPYQESASYLFASYEWFKAQYERLMNIDAYALTEDFREGPYLLASLSVASRAIGGRSDFLLPGLTLGHNWKGGESLYLTSISANTRYQPGLNPKTDWLNRNYQGSFKYYSPFFGKFRAVAATNWVSHAFDLSKTQETLGGNGALRGYPSAYLRGTHYFTVNFEIRSVPVRFLNTYWGLVVFQDWGDAFNQVEALTLKPTLGAGLRMVFPQFTRDAWRLDVGIPLHARDMALGPTAVFQYAQAI